MTEILSADDVLDWSLALPAETAVIECDPTASVEMLNVACPPAIVPVPSVVVPSLNVTEPVAAEGETVEITGLCADCRNDTSTIAVGAW